VSGVRRCASRVEHCRAVRSNSGKMSLVMILPPLEDYELVLQQITISKNVYPSADKEQYDVCIACFPCIGLAHDILSSVGALHQAIRHTINAMSELRH
jgi:hypothetical protein